MPRTAEANQRIRDAQRAKILEAAWKVFAQQGRAATMADVAAVAEVSNGLVYRYFASKEAIFQSLIKQALHSTDAALQRFEELHGTPGERLDDLLSRMVESRRDHPEVSQLHDQVLSDEATPSELRALAARHSQALQDTLRRLIVDGQTTGEVRAADPDQLVTAVLAMLDGLTRMAVINPERFHEHFPDASIIGRMLKADAHDRDAKRGGNGMKRKGVCYDVGRVIMGDDGRPEYDPQIVHRELEIIKADLHCTAVRICGQDIDRLMTAAEDALNQGFDVWVSPELWDHSPHETLDYIATAAVAAEKLRRRWPERLVFSVGSELTLFMKGILSGDTLLERLGNPFTLAFTIFRLRVLGTHNKPLNAFLARANQAVRDVFHGPVTYASAGVAPISWSGGRVR